MKKYLQTLSLLLVLTACSKQKQITPKAACNCTEDYVTHPKNAEYQALLNKYQSKGFPGISLLVDNPADGKWKGASGFAGIENRTVLTTCHQHHAASIYKSFAATCILQLVKENKLKLEDKIATYLTPEMIKKVPNAKLATIEQLLQHRSGIPDIYEANFLLKILNRPYKEYTLASMIETLYNKKPIGAPGTSFYYSDGNYALLSYVLSKLDGSYLSSIRNRIFLPAQMTNSIIINEPDQIPTALCCSYWDRHSNGYLENVSNWQIHLAANLKGQDGIITPLEDMHLYLRALTSGKLLDANQLNKMTSFKDIPENERHHGFSAYGLGIGKVQVSKYSWYGHFGSHVGSAAIALYNPEKNTTVVVYTNLGTFFSDTYKEDFYVRLIQDIEGIAFK